MGIKVESMEPEVWDAVRAIARDEVSKVAQPTTAVELEKPVIAVISVPKGKGKAVKAGLIALAILFAGSGSVLAEEPLGLINPRNLDLTQTSAVWAFSTTVTTPRIEATTAVIAAPSLTGTVAVGDGTGAVTFDSGTYHSGFNDEDIINVADIGLDTISADDGSSFVISDDFTNAGNTIADLGTVTTADINGGTADGVVIGGASAAAVTGSTITGTTITDGTASLASGTFSGIADLGTVTTADINAGTFDGTIGGTTPAAIDGTTITGTTITDGTASVTAGTFSGIADLGSVTTADINAGTVDAVVGGTTPAAGSFTTLGASSTITLENDETIGNATDGIVDVVGDFQNRGAFNYAGESISTDLNTYVLNAIPDLVVTAPTVGQVVTWKSETAGDGASTVSVDGVADTLQDRAGNATAAGDIVDGGMVIMIFDGTNWRLEGI